MARVAINGFGRIGRNFLRAYLERRPDFEIVAVNDLGDVETMAHLLEFDSLLGRLSEKVTAEPGTIWVGDRELRAFSIPEPADLPWRELGIDVVVESTGRFIKREQAQAHLDAGASRVVISAVASDADVMVVLGVNDDAFDAERHRIVSNASCTTNCVTPLARVLHDTFGIERGFMTTVHAYTGEMLLIRRFEEKVTERFRAGDLAGFLHACIGQEAVAVGVCRALGDDDVIGSTHRAHGHVLANGTPPNEVMAELYGKLEGCSQGYGGSMHLYDIERGNMGANAVVGGGLPAMVGAALTFKLRGQSRVAVAFLGDGATNSGAFHESLNLAQLWHVPIVFVCENNRWAESTGLGRHRPAPAMPSSTCTRRDEATRPWKRRDLGAERKER